MTKNIKKMIALIIVAVMVFCFASCADNKGQDETTNTPATVYPVSEDSTTTANEAVKTTANKSKDGENLSTVVLTTAPGGIIPTVVTSQWNTTLPEGVTTAYNVETTAMILTVPGGNVTVPQVYSSIAITTVSTTESTTVTTTESTTNSLPTTDVITQTDPNGKVITVYSTEGTTAPARKSSEETESGSETDTQTSTDVLSETETVTQTTEVQPQGINLVESGFCGFDSNGLFLCGVLGTGLPETFKVKSAKIDVAVNGTVIKKVTVTANTYINDDGEIEIYLKTGADSIQPGDNVQFTLPEGFIQTNDGLLYSNEKQFSVFA